MPDPSDPADQTHKSDHAPRGPLEAETRDAPPAPPGPVSGASREPGRAEPGTLTARTHTNDDDPHTASLPRAGTAEPVVEPPGFAIVRELGQGGMGVVYEARQARLNRRVALKVLRGGRDSPQDVVRFLTEAEAVAAIAHPHVVQVFEVGQHAGGPFMALELLTGGTLSGRLRAGGRMDPRAAAELVAKLAGAIQAAHELGIVHRDLKPSNVLFDDRGVPKVTDFGLAKKGGTDITRTQAMLGTPAYMAPEQARGEAKFVGPPADIWALGAILYECLTGKRAFEANDTWAVLRKVIDEAPPAPRAYVPGLPRDLELVALKCLEKNPTDRYPSAAALAADLESYLAGRPVSVHPAGPLKRTAKWAKRNPAVAALMAAVALALVAGSAVSVAFALEAHRQSEKVSRTNDELTRTNDDLTNSRNTLDAQTRDLTKSRNDLAASVKDVERAQQDAEERGYLSNVALAHQLWRANDLRGMRAALERCPPAWRKWEWHYLDRISHPERAVYPTDSMPLALAYSPDGKALAYLTLSGTLTVRERATGRETNRYTPEAADGHQRTLAFHPNGKELALAVGHRVWVLDLETNRVKELLRGEPAPGDVGPIDYLALWYAADGRLLCGGEVRGQRGGKMAFTIRDGATDKTVATLDAGEMPAGVLAHAAGGAFSADGTRFAASIIDSGIRVSSKGEEAKFDPYRPVVMVWDIASEKRLGETEGGNTIFGTVAFDPNGRQVGFGRRGLACELDSAAPGPTRLVGGGHTGEVLAVAFDKNGLIWSGGEDKLVHGHDRRTSAERFVLRGCSHGVLRLAASPDGGEVAAAVGDVAGVGSVYRFDVAALSKDVWRAPTGRDRPSLVAALAPDGSRFAACDFSLDRGEASTRFVIRGVADATERKVEPARRWIGGAFRPDGSLFALDTEARLWAIGADGTPGAEIALHDEVQFFASPPRVACSPDGKTIAVVDASRPPDEHRAIRARVLTWDADTQKPGKSAELDLTSTVPPGAENASLIPTGAKIDGRGRLAASFVVSWSMKGRTGTALRGAVAVWNLTTGEEPFRQVTLDPLHAAGFDPEGRVVAAGGGPAGGVVFGWDVETGRREFAFLGHTRPILALAFGPDGRLATGGLDRVVKVWDVASRREVLTLDGFAREVTHVTFTADGRNLVAATGVDLVNSLMLVGGIPSEWPAAEVRTFRGPK